MTVHVELRGFGWRHAGRRAWAVRGVDLRIERGERVLLLGSSGAGKSTLLVALAGLLAADSGEQEGSVVVDGREARPASALGGRSHSARERGSNGASGARDGVGIVFQDPETQLVMSRAGDDVAFGLENRGVPAGRIWSDVDDALAAVGFLYPRDRSTAALSGGEKQRLALAGAVATRPSLLLLDEPTANLDPAGARLVRAAIEGIQDTTLVLVEHRVAEALYLVDRVVVLEAGGGIAADGQPERVFREQGDRLAEQGVWVPGRSVTPRRAGSPAGPVQLRCSHVSLHPPGVATPALRPIDFEVRAGETLAVVGPNGVGKTTLALLMGGLLAPTTGRLTASADLAPSGRAEPHRWPALVLAQRIGSVFQDPEHQFLRTRVVDEMALGPRRAGRRDAEVRSIVDDLMARLRLGHLAMANPYTLSGGEQRRLSVATALATAPRVLVLDEPTFGQDRRTWLELVDLLAKLRDDGTAVVTVTHDSDFVAALADRRLELAGPVVT